MKSLTVTRNGQITLPKRFREKHAIREGMHLFVEETEDGLLIKRNDPSFWDNVPRCLPDDFKETLAKMRAGDDERFERLFGAHSR